MEIEAGKPRAELGKVLQTLATLDLSLSLSGDGIPGAGDAEDPIEKVEIHAIVDAHRRPSP